MSGLISSRCFSTDSRKHTDCWKRNRRFLCGLFNSIKWSWSTSTWMQCTVCACLWTAHEYFQAIKITFHWHFFYSCFLVILHVMCYKEKQWCFWNPDDCIMTFCRVLFLENLEAWLHSVLRTVWQKVMVFPLKLLLGWAVSHLYLSLEIYQNRSVAGWLQTDFHTYQAF